MFEIVRKILKEKQLIIKNGTCVDATIIEAPISIKDKNKKRDPDMNSPLRAFFVDDYVDFILLHKISPTSSSPLSADLPCKFSRLLGLGSSEKLV